VWKAEKTRKQPQRERKKKVKKNGLVWERKRERGHKGE